MSSFATHPEQLAQAPLERGTAASNFLRRSGVRLLSARSALAASLLAHASGDLGRINQAAFTLSDLIPAYQYWPAPTRQPARPSMRPGLQTAGVSRIAASAPPWLMATCATSSRSPILQRPLPGTTRVSLWWTTAFRRCSGTSRTCAAPDTCRTRAFCSPRIRSSKTTRSFRRRPFNPCWTISGRPAAAARIRMRPCIPSSLPRWQTTTQLSPTEINLLANLTGWIVMNAQSQFRKQFQS